MPSLHDFLKQARLESDVAAGRIPEAELAGHLRFSGTGGTLIVRRGFTTAKGWEEHYRQQTMACDTSADGSAPAVDEPQNPRIYEAPPARETPHRLTDRVFSLDR